MPSTRLADDDFEAFQAAAEHDAMVDVEIEVNEPDGSPVEVSVLYDQSPKLSSR